MRCRRRTTSPLARPHPLESGALGLAVDTYSDSAEHRTILRPISASVPSIAPSTLRPSAMPFLREYLARSDNAVPEPPASRPELSKRSETAPAVEVPRHARQWRN